MTALRRIEGALAGARPGRVTLRTEGAALVDLDATPAQVEHAESLSGHVLIAMSLVTDAGARLLWLRRAGDPPALPPPDERSAALRAAWSRTLEILSQ